MFLHRQVKSIGTCFSAISSLDLTEWKGSFCKSDQVLFCFEWPSLIRLVQVRIVLAKPCLCFLGWWHHDWSRKEFCERPRGGREDIVVYFDQQTHACTCICMVENDKKRLKMIKNILFSSCVREAHVRLMYKYEVF